MYFLFYEKLYSKKVREEGNNWIRVKSIWFMWFLNINNKRDLHIFRMLLEEGKTNFVAIEGLLPRQLLLLLCPQMSMFHLGQNTKRSIGSGVHLKVFHYYFETKKCVPFKNSYNTFLCSTTNNNKKCLRKRKPTALPNFEKKIMFFPDQ